MTVEEIRTELNPELRTQKALLGLYWSIAPIMFLTIALAWWKYPNSLVNLVVWKVSMIFRI
ncbi:MAG: hypothetical protein ACTSR1_14125 [Candidatus Heimdallarchaeota archaeon]